MGNTRSLFKLSAVGIACVALLAALVVWAPAAFAQTTQDRQVITTAPAEKDVQQATLTSIKSGWWAIDSSGRKVDESYGVEYTGKYLNPVAAITNGKTTIKRPAYSPYFEKNKAIGTATVMIRGNTARGYTDSFTLKFKIVAKAASNGYGIIKSDGYLHRTNAALKDYGTSWGTTESAAKKAIDEITHLYIDANVTSLEKVNVKLPNGKSREVFFTYNTLNWGPDNLQRIEFLLNSAGVNKCSTMKDWYMFGKQPNLRQVVNFDKTQLSTVPSGCFYQCSALTSISLPATLKSIGNSAFYDCDSLKVLDVPASVKAIGNNLWNDAAIGGCDNLQKLILRSTTMVVVQRNQLRDTNKNLKIYVPNSVLSKYKEQINSNGWYSYMKNRLPNIHPFLEVSNIPGKLYTGKAIKPAVSVTWIGTKLAASNYAVAYKNNVKVGTATATVTGKNGYTGTVSKTFRIKSWSRLWGNKALDTMQAITKSYGKASTAVVATNANFKDSLAASALAGSLNAPMLTTAKASLSAQTKSELARMGVKTVYLVGSTSDVAAKVVTQMKQAGVKTVKRIAGNSASAKAINCAKAQSVRSDTVIIATQNNFKDALSVSSYAYASKSPVLYAETGKSLSAATINYIKTAGFKQAIIVGGPVALPSSVESQLSSAGIWSSRITRLAGSNEYKTSRIIAEWAMGSLANYTGGKQGDFYEYTKVRFQPAVKLSANKLGVARANQNKIGWKDALAGAALCGKNKSVLVLADAKNTAQAQAFVKAKKASISYGYVFGGVQAVPKAAMDKLVNASL